MLGIEEGRAYSAHGHAASIAPNPMSEAGIATSLRLVPDGEADVRHVIGGAPLPAGWTAISSVEAGPTALTLRGEAGAELSLPFDLDFLFPR